MSVTLTLVGTALYAPADAVAAQYARFLRWSTQSPPGQLTLEDVWPSSGTPASVGYFAFVDGPVPAGFEDALRALLPAAAPTATGFAWVSVTGAAPALKALAAVEEEASGVRRLSADVPFALPPGALDLVLAGGSEMRGATGAGGTFDGITAAYPALEGAQGPNGTGISIALAGQGTGALGFQALLDAGGGGTGDTVLQLWDVQIDPLRPFDASRTFQSYTPRAYLLSNAGGVYHLTPLA